MKNIYGKLMNANNDERPIPTSEDNLFNNPYEREMPSELKKVKKYYKSQKYQINENN